ncbi:flagellar protein FlaG [Anaerobacillus isosaccharinicus]|uniref:Flagellar protein FlaG n=1 Tax=Anaerobacillus isosaccharinicus TaxID=1532552 RepID=A0A1S2L923_9BACI|nr:flagellar protein FlaG [Anaerobacillus isosaccharinicus]MBA5584612.1 flagellar protein FlaG [Anaerobacillus isosaccharinicus]QOY37009.1 flagellar protein FlaG [Anaerobacillus isosaccharinicus]
MEISRTQISNFTPIHSNTTQPKHHDNVVQPDVKNIKKEDVSDVQKKIDSVNQFLKSANTNIKFSLHEDLNEYYITIIDEETKEVIKEVPPKKLLDIYAAMINTVGLFIDKKI